MSDFTSDELNDRIGRLREHLAQSDIDLAVLTANSDVYYYSGSVQPLYLVVPAEGVPIILARKAVNRLGVEAAHLAVEYFTSGKELAAITERYGVSSARRVGLTLDIISYASVGRLQSLFPDAELVDLSWDIRRLRMVKSEAEIALHTKAAEIVSAVPHVARSSFRPGMTELEFSAAFEHHFRIHGHAGFLRMRREGAEMPVAGVLSSGSNTLAGTKFDGICSGMGLSAATPYGANNDPIRKGVPVLLDFGVNYDGYIVDQTRMFCWGRPKDEVTRAYDAMLGVEQTIFDRMKPAVSWEDVYAAAVDRAAALGYEETFMGLGAEKVRFVGHGVGLELDEPPFIAPKMPYPLEAGMVVALEPKAALPGIGIVGIEDTVVVRDKDVERLTDCARDLIVVE